MIDPEILGYLGGALTTGAYLPQAIKIFREKRTQGVSLAMYLVMATGILLWIAYGFLKGDLPLLIANVVTLSLVIPILIMKIRLG